MESLYLNHNELTALCKSVSGGANQKFPSFQIFRLAAGGLGGAALKMIGNFWVCRARPAGARPRRSQREKFCLVYLYNHARTYFSKNC